MIEHLFEKLSRRDDVTVCEREALAAVLRPPGHFRAGQALVVPGESITASKLLLHGFAARVDDMVDGRRQITALHVPGDFVDLQAFVFKTVNHEVVALTDCVACEIPHARLTALDETMPHLTRLLWLETLVDASIQRTWLTGLGRRDAMERLAHLLCELGLRLDAANVGVRDAYPLPLTQTQLADIVGLTTVHVNRTLMTLRERGLIVWTGATLRILDWDGLVALSGFDDAYLRLAKAPV